MKILLIEDNEQNRYLTTFLLEKRGHEVHCAPDGPQGIEMARQLDPEVVLLDMQLPRMNGYAVARALRSIDAFADRPIVAVTSFAMVGDREKCFEGGCTGYIEKPIDPETFVQEIEDHVSERGSSS